MEISGSYYLHKKKNQVYILGAVHFTWSVALNTQFNHGFARRRGLSASSGTAVLVSAILTYNYCHWLHAINANARVGGISEALQSLLTIKLPLCSLDEPYNQPSGSLKWPETELGVIFPHSMGINKPDAFQNHTSRGVSVSIWVSVWTAHGDRKKQTNCSRSPEINRRISSSSW